MKMRWRLNARGGDATLVDRLAKEFDLPKVIIRLMVQRGIDTPEAVAGFLDPRLSRQHAPELMPGMTQAVERIEQARQNNESVLVYGDYDADGTLAASLVVNFLRDLGMQPHYYIPHRINEGYGISSAGIEWAIREGIGLMITVDCGIRDTEQIKNAGQAGIDVIVCDHHIPGLELPPAYVILNPKVEPGVYPFSELCGCGVAYKLLLAYCRAYGRDQWTVNRYLDMVAVATVADLVPLVDENRILVHQGLRVLSQCPSLGLGALASVLNPEGPPGSIDSETIAYSIGPAINSAGRIAEATRVVELMTTEDADQAQALARELLILNAERKAIDRETGEQALAQLRADPQHAKRTTTIVYAPGWNKGVVGIVASRLQDHYYRPTIVLTEVEGEITGSARSVGHYNVYEAIHACRDLLTQYGGHAAAAGLTIRPGRLNDFMENFERYVAATIRPADLIPEQHIDLQMGLEQISPRLVEALGLFEPCGNGHPKPVFATFGLEPNKNVGLMGADNDHMYASLTLPHYDYPVRAIGFWKAEWEDLMFMHSHNICYNLSLNHFRGETKLQLMLCDVQTQETKQE